MMIGRCLVVTLLMTCASAQAQYLINSNGDAGRAAAANFGVCDTGDTVTNPDTSQEVAECTLRALIETINEFTSGDPATAGIVDWIPTSGTPPKTFVVPQTPLPAIDWPLHLDGTTHPDYDFSVIPTPRIVLEGSQLSGLPSQSANGLLITSGGSGSHIEAINVRLFPDAGIAILADNVRVSRNRIGTDTTGGFPVGNGLGIVINGNNNVIGQVAQAAGDPSPAPTSPVRNVISANQTGGIWVIAGEGNRIVNNNIGTNYFGTAALPNGNVGVLVDDDAVGTIIGENSSVSPAILAGNLFAGHAQRGIEIRGSGTRVRCNYFGWNRFLDGTLDADLVAVEIAGASASDNIIGQESCPNFIRAVNTAVRVDTPPGSNGAENRIQWNTIGTNEDGMDPGETMSMGVLVTQAGSSDLVTDNVIGHVAVGIELQSDSDGFVVSDNWVGVTPAGVSVPIVYEAIFVQGTDHSIQGNTVGHASTGIAINSDGHQVLSNFIGAGASGEFWPIGEFGLDVTGDGNVIFNNRLGNAEIGILVDGDDNQVRRNWVGTTFVGGEAVDIGHSGVGIEVSGSGNDIGGPLATHANTLGFNQGPGVRLIGANNRVRRNRIGVSANGQAIGNAGPGVEVLGSASTARISETPEEGNFIGNNSTGIDVGAPFAIIVGNTLGSSEAGGMHGNQGNGILVRDGVNDSIIELNTIAHSTSSGVFMHAGAGQRNRIKSTEFIGNNGKGIHLGPGGRDQDPGDADTGANNLQNFPDFDLRNSGYNPDTGLIDLEFRVDSHPDNSNYPIGIEVFLADPDAIRPQGMLLLGDYLYQESDAQQWITVELEPVAGIDLQEFDLLVATATTADGNTSEFSDPFGMAPFITIGGEVNGLNGTLVIQDDNFGGSVTIANVGDVPFTMPNAYYPDESYSISIPADGMPSGQQCVINNPQGPVGWADSTDVSVQCATLEDELFRDRFEPLISQM
jgi:hypothetical protein